MNSTSYFRHLQPLICNEAAYAKVRNIHAAVQAVDTWKSEILSNQVILLDDNTDGFTVHYLSKCGS